MHVSPESDLKLAVPHQLPKGEPMAFMSRSTVSLLALCLIGAYGCEDLEVRPAPAVDPGPETPTPAPEVQDEEPELLEPMMDVEVRTPEDYMGDVIGDLNSRRGQVQSMDSAGNLQIIKALVPLERMFGYATEMRSKTQGRAVYTMTFKEYAPVPQSVADTIIAKVKGL